MITLANGQLVPVYLGNVVIDKSPHAVHVGDNTVRFGQGNEVQLFYQYNPRLNGFTLVKATIPSAGPLTVVTPPPLSNPGPSTKPPMGTQQKKIYNEPVKIVDSWEGFGLLPASDLPNPTQSQIDGTIAVWSRYIRFQGSPSDVEQLQRLFTQAVLFKRANGKSSMAMREVVGVLVEYGQGSRTTIAFGAGNLTDRNFSGGERDSFITIENYNAVGVPVTDEYMVVSIMHELLHAADRIRGGMSLIEWHTRHMEIFRIQNQTLFDLRLDLDDGDNGAPILDKNGQPDGDKYIGID